MLFSVFFLLRDNDTPLTLLRHVDMQGEGSQEYTFLVRNMVCTLRGLPVWPQLGGPQLEGGAPIGSGLIGRNEQVS